MTDDNKGQSNATVRTITILETLSKHKKINLGNLSKETKLPKATLLRFLSSLTGLGYVFRDDNDLYSLTLKLFSISSRVLSHVDLIEAARPFSEKLSKTLGETVHMGIYEENQAVYILKIESLHTIRMYSRVGKTIPLYCTAIGKIILSDMEEEEREKYLKETDFFPFTPYTLDRDKLREELKIVEKQNWSTDAQEHEPGITCLGGRITDYTGKTVAGLSVSWPQFRYREELKDQYIKEIQDACLNISKLLGALD